MKTIEEITAEILAEAPEAWRLANQRNWHRLVLTVEGVLYWAEECDRASMPHAVFKGSAVSLLHFEGPRTDADASPVFEDQDISAAEYMKHAVEKAEEFLTNLTETI